MISLQIVAEFLDTCGGRAKIMASPPQVLIAGPSPAIATVESVRPMQEGLDSPLSVRRHVLHAPVITAPNRCYDYRISNGARKTTDLVSVSRVRFFTARRCTSAVYAVVACPSVRPTVRHLRVLCQND